jgi:hypothetical protein
VKKPTKTQVRREREREVMSANLSRDDYQFALQRAASEAHCSTAEITAYGMKVTFAGLPPAAVGRMIDALDAIRKEDEAKRMERPA